MTKRQPSERCGRCAAGCGKGHRYTATEAAAEVKHDSSGTHYSFAAEKSGGRARTTGTEVRN